MFFLAKYNTQTTFYFPMVKRGVVDLAVSADWTPAATDSAISKDGGNWADTANTVATDQGGAPTRTATGWKITLTAAELSAAEVNVQIVDATTKAVEDQWLTIYTYGNASAKIQADLSDSVRLGLTALPNAAAEAAGGLYTRGSGAGQIRQDANGRVDANAKAWIDGAIPAVNVTGVPLVDAKYLLGTTIITPNTPGLMDVNAKQIGAVAQTGGDIFPAVTNIGATAAPQNAIAASRVITTGTETGTLANSNTLDGVFHNIADVAGTIDFYDQFDLSAITNAFVTSVAWDGYVVGVVNTVKVYAYNWGAAGWDQIGSIVGIAGAVIGSQEWDLTSAHIGTGGNLGLVRIRFNAAGLTTATVKTDRILLGYGVTPNTTVPDNASIAAIDTRVLLALPNAAPNAAGGLLITTAGTLDMDDLAADVDAVETRVALSLPAAAPAANGGLPTVNASNYVAGVVAAVTTTYKIKKNTAFLNFGFVMTDSTSHAPKAGLGAAVTPTRRLDGGVFGACANAVAEVSSGVYTIDLDAGDLNADVVILRFTAAGADDRLIEIVTQS